MQHVCGRSDGIAAQVELQTGLLGSGDETIGSGLVAGDVHITAGHLVLGLNAVYVCHTAVCVVSVVVSGLDNLDVGICHSGFLGKLLAQEIESDFQVAVEQPAHQSQGKHVAALEHALYVHSAVLETILYHGGQGAGNHTVGVDAHLAQIIGGLEGCLFQILGTE